jgi:hypothetical protein
MNNLAPSAYHAPAELAPSAPIEHVASSIAMNSLRQLFAAERELASFTEAGRPLHTRPRHGRGDVAAKRAADRRQRQARKIARGLKRDRS